MFECHAVEFDGEIKKLMIEIDDVDSKNSPIQGLRVDSFIRVHVASKKGK